MECTLSPPRPASTYKWRRPSFHLPTTGLSSSLLLLSRTRPCLVRPRVGRKMPTNEVVLGCKTLKGILQCNGKWHKICCCFDLIDMNLMLWSTCSPAIVLVKKYPWSAKPKSSHTLQMASRHGGVHSFTFIKDLKRIKITESNETSCPAFLRSSTVSLTALDIPGVGGKIPSWV